MERIWLKNYCKDVPADINPDSYSSLVELFDHSFTQFADKPAFYNLGVTLTYQQVNHYSRDFAAYLQHVLKLKKGDRVALMMPNILQYPIALFGLLRAGLTAVNVNPLYTPPEVIHQLNDAQVETIIVLTHFAPTLEKVLALTSLKHIILTDLWDLFPPIKAWVTRFYLSYIKRKNPKVSIPEAHWFKRVLAEGKKYSLTPIPLYPSDLAFLQYTGGTTGVAKGAMLTHRNISANILQAEAWFNPVFLPGKEIIITALPLYHIFSLTANCLFLSKIGGFNILITNPRDILSMISEMKKFKFTAITAVNTLFNSLLNQPKFAKLDFSRLHVSLGGGMPVQRVVAERWQAVTGCPLLEAYGLTETSPCATINPTNLTSYNGTIGLPVSSTDICIVDDEGKNLPLGEVGELAIKGPQVMLGYWQNPEETAKVLNPSGWLLTGDLGTMDSGGFIRILERKKDMILVSGFNVYPNEIEDTLMHLPGVLEAAVIGIPDENSGEAVKAFIVKSNPELSISDIIAFCRKNLTPYKIPKEIEFRDTLPKTNVGKILRRALSTKNRKSDKLM